MLSFLLFATGFFFAEPFFAVAFLVEGFLLDGFLLLFDFAVITNRLVQVTRLEKELHFGDVLIE